MTSAWALYLRSVLSSSGRTRTGSPVADRKSTRLNSSHLVISYAVLFFKKNTRLNSSHLVISYAVFCLKKKKQHNDAILFMTKTILEATVPQRIDDYDIASTTATLAAS